LGSLDHANGIKNLVTDQSSAPEYAPSERCAAFRCSLTWHSLARIERGGCSVGSEENKAAQRRIIDEVINRKNLDLADELFSEEHKLHPETPGVDRGPEGMKGAFAGLHEDFPDIHVEIEDIVAEGDMVAVRLTFSGTHAPTGELATWPEMVFARFSEGKAVESWEVTDTGRGWDSAPW
jgi:predicted SnoaL-like aldol condensation-catalyzing enzyme